MTPGPVTVVSGGSRGLGLALVEAFLARGDRVATFSRSGSQPIDGLAAAHPDRLFVERLDAADLAAVRDFVARVAARFGGIDHCVANAAVAYEGVLATTADAEIESLLAVNLAGAIVLVRECVRQFLVRPAGTGPGPAVVLMSSVVASRGSPGLSVYAATKGAVEAFARSLARELGPRGVRVNCVAPGFVETELSATLSAEDRARIVRRTALGRLGLPADVVGATTFLTSAASAFVTGQVIAVDGGA
jgi:3-oxoacyl-[acyl-carrier protein] reductase